MRPRTSAAATSNAVAKVGAIPTFLTLDSDSYSVAQEKGSARTGTTGTKAAKRASTQSSRLPSKAPKKAKKSKKARRRRKKESSSSSPSGRDDRHRGRGRSPSMSASSSSSSGYSDWEEFYANFTVVKVRHMLKTAPPRAPRDVSKSRFSFEALTGEVLYVRKADKGKKDKWMRESRSRRSDHYADYKGSISRLRHSGNNRVLRRNFGACFQPLMAVEKVLMTVPMRGSARRDLVQGPSRQVVPVGGREGDQPHCGRLRGGLEVEGRREGPGRSCGQVCQNEEVREAGFQHHRGGRRVSQGGLQSVSLQRGQGARAGLSRVSANADGPLYLRVPKAGSKARCLLRLPGTRSQEGRCCL
jgi:hypothetical protein